MGADCWGKDKSEAARYGEPAVWMRVIDPIRNIGTRVTYSKEVWKNGKYGGVKALMKQI